MSDDGYFRQICRHLGFVCASVDRDLKIRFWNDHAVSQFGGTAEERVGQSFLDILQEQDRDEARRVFMNTLETGTPGELEIRFQSADEDRRTTMILIVSPIIDESGKCMGASASMRDISQRKRLSQELARSRRMASLGKMAGAVAHHFNNILGGMMTSIDCAMADDSPRELRKALRLLAESIGRATRITQQLGSFAESEVAQEQLAELDELVGKFVERLKRQCQAKRVQLVTKLSAAPSGLFDAHRLLPVLESIACNAFDAMPDGGTMTLEMRQEADQVIIALSDTGCGIPDEAMDHIFEPFFTTKGDLGNEEGNIGLGLAAVHGLVAEMGGSISISSKVGRGTQVQIRLPRRRHEDHVAAAVSNSDAR